MEGVLKEFSKDKLAPYKRPAHIIFVSDMPKASSG
ncbi:AMP-binding enzyme [Flexibacterium corallicola]